MLDLGSSRAAVAALNAGLYESHFLTAVDPAGGRALWLRYTALKQRGAPAQTTVWLTWFNRAGGRQIPTRVGFRVPAREPLQDPGELWSRSSLGSFGPGRALGALSGTTHWALSWESRSAELSYLPARWLHDRPLPRSNGASLAPVARVDGTLMLPDESVGLNGWEGTVGHNWGSEHAEQWSWIHAGGLGDDRSGWLDLTLVRVRVGPVLTPWLAAGALMLDGQSHVPARRAGVVRGVFGERTATSLALRGGGHLELEIEAPAAVTQAWEYEAPSGPGRTVTNCSVADATIRLDSGRSLEVRGRLAVEHGGPAAVS